jgi:hypothetical protein
MPPEQLLGERVDARGDLFSLGVVFYEMLTGGLPFPESEEDSGILLERMRRERYLPVRKQAREVPRWLARLIRSCLRSRRRKRIQTASELRRELERRLQPPSPAELRAELARWLWDRGVFTAREGETVVKLASPPSGARRSHRLSHAAAGLAALLVAASLLAARLRLEPDQGTHARVDGGPRFPIVGRMILELPPGPHVVAFERPGGDVEEHTLELVSGREQTAQPGQSPAPASPPTPPSAAP